MPPTLEQVFTMRLGRSKADTLELGPTKGGPPRFVSPIPYGDLSSISPPTPTTSPIKASIVQGGSDWLTVDPITHTGHLNVRCQFRDHLTGGVYYMHFTGIIALDDKTQPILQWAPEAKTTASSDHYAFAYPVFEVSRQQDKWMEQTAFVAHQHFYHPGDGTSAVEFEVYKLLTG